MSLMTCVWTKWRIWTKWHLFAHSDAFEQSDAFGQSDLFEQRVFVSVWEQLKLLMKWYIEEEEDQSLNLALFQP